MVEAERELRLHVCWAYALLCSFWRLWPAEVRVVRETRQGSRQGREGVGNEQEMRQQRRVGSPLERADEASCSHTVCLDSVDSF